ncbi:MAG: hypothetical protein DMG78_22305 [Acidobacteria bacterium]|nr:MAG: hypothetical protein DMG78_22305 [Acidobacteriota bacterium]
MQHIQRREQNPIDPPKNADTSKRLMEIIPQGANLGTICLSVGEVTVGSDQDYACRRYVVVEWLRICRVFGRCKAVRLLRPEEKAAGPARNSLYNDSFCIVGLNFLIMEGFDVRGL